MAQVTQVNSVESVDLNTDMEVRYGLMAHATLEIGEVDKLQATVYSIISMVMSSKDSSKQIKPTARELIDIRPAKHTLVIGSTIYSTAKV
jgi:hypothetical protein